MSHWGVVIEQLTHEDDAARRSRLRRVAARRGRRRWSFLSRGRSRALAQPKPTPTGGRRAVAAATRAVPRLGRG